MDTAGMSLNMSRDIVNADLSASEFLGMCLGICDPLLDVFVVQETLLKALMLQPGIGLFSLVIRQNRRIDYRKGDHDLP